jgi:hypothetical protein
LSDAIAPNKYSEKLTDVLKELRRRVMRKVFLAPTVVLPVVVGLSAWLISWAGDGVTAMNFAGLIGVLGGMGWAATRAIFGMEKFAHQAYEEMSQESVQAETAQLDQLDQLLCQDNDPRDQELLRMLRSQRAQFREIAGQPSLTVRSSEVLARVETLFRASVKNLSECYQLWMAAQQLGRNEQRALMMEREKLIQEIRLTVEQVQKSLSEYKELSKRAVGVDLNELRGELESSIEIAKRTEERLRELEVTPGRDYHREAE